MVFVYMKGQTAVGEAAVCARDTCDLKQQMPKRMHQSELRVNARRRRVYMKWSHVLWECMCIACHIYMKWSALCGSGSACALRAHIYPKFLNVTKYSKFFLNMMNGFHSRDIIFQKIPGLCPRTPLINKYFDN